MLAFDAVLGAPGIDEGRLAVLVALVSGMLVVTMLAAVVMLAALVIVGGLAAVILAAGDAAELLVVVFAALLLVVVLRLAGVPLVVGLLAGLRLPALAALLLVNGGAAEFLVVVMLAALLLGVEAISGVAFVGFAVLAGVAAARHGAAAALLNQRWRAIQTVLAATAAAAATALVLLVASVDARAYRQDQDNGQDRHRRDQYLRGEIQKTHSPLLKGSARGDHNTSSRGVEAGSPEISKGAHLRWRARGRSGIRR